MKVYRILMPGPMGLAREQLRNAGIPALPLGVRNDGQVTLWCDGFYERILGMWRNGWVRTLAPGEAQGHEPSQTERVRQ